MAASMATRKRNTSARYVTYHVILHAILTLQLLYIYILGWNVDFGHLEAVNLISATKYSEKQIGYLAVTLFLHEEHELIHLVVNSIRKDLLDHNELNNCLALHAIANVGGKELGEALSAEVHRLLISPLVVIERGQWLS
jgi:AP-2 complex subunit alpha